MGSTGGPKKNFFCFVALRVLAKDQKTLISFTHAAGPAINGANRIPLRQTLFL